MDKSYIDKLIDEETTTKPIKKINIPDEVHVHMAMAINKGMEEFKIEQAKERINNESKIM